MLKNSLLVLLSFLFSAQALSASELRVAMSADYPPLHFKQDGKFYGVEPDNARAIGEIIRRRIRIVELPFAELMPALLEGKVDVIMSGLSVTQERAKRVQFIDSYLDVGQMAIMHRDKLNSFAQPWAIYRAGARIGVEPNTTGAEFAEQKLPDALIRYFEDAEAAFAGLRGDEIDLYIHDAPTSWRLASTMEDDDLISLYNRLTEEELAWAVRPDDTELATALNAGLTLMRSNGTLQYILNRWIPVQVEVN